MAAKNTLGQLKKRERAVRQDLIIDAARTVFGSKTFDRTSMQEIADEAGIAKSSIYTYFVNQESLFVEVAFRDTNRFIDTLEAAASGGEAAIESVLHHFIDFCTRNESYWRMITRFALYGRLGKDSIRKLDVVARRLMDLLESLFEARGVAGADVRLLSHALFAAVSGILVAFRRYPGRSDAEIFSHMRAIGDVVIALFEAHISDAAKAVSASPQHQSE